MLALVVILIAPWQKIAAADDAYLLSLSAARPPCTNSETATLTASGSRCYGTRPAETRLEMPAGRIVYLDPRAEVPVEWLFVGPLFLRTDDLLEPGIGYRIRETSAGLRLEVFINDRMRSSAVDLNTWTPALTPDDREIWVRLSRLN